MSPVPRAGDGKIELLAPARNLDCGLAALDCGADAVYIGANRFSAREDAGNSVEDIAKLAKRAHFYWARVYAALNTILTDGELSAAARLAWELQEAGVDGLIIQDFGLLEKELPPLPLIASTQMHNHTPQKVAFLEKLGFSRVILARELCLDEIRAIRQAAPSIGLECFVHGSLCVSHSGQCHLSYALGGRSGNRGQCAQPCRLPYTLRDREGRVIASDRHLLSLKDLDLSGHLAELIEAGAAGFKIEGRLRDRTHVANATAWFRKELDAVMAGSRLSRASSGISSPGFQPDLSRSFQRGGTTGFLMGRKKSMACLDTPKAMGPAVAKVKSAGPGGLSVEWLRPVVPGDGLCFLDAKGLLCGFHANRIENDLLVPRQPAAAPAGATLHRNHDHDFDRMVSSCKMERKIRVILTLSGKSGELILKAEDEDGNATEELIRDEFPPAEKPDKASEVIRKQLSSFGATDYSCAELRVTLRPLPFFPVSRLNALRRSVLESLSVRREEKRPRLVQPRPPCPAPYPAQKLDFRANVLNRQAEAFLRKCGVEQIERAAESGLDMKDRPVMRTKYCLRFELGMCPGPDKGSNRPSEPLYLEEPQGRILELLFDCENCGMEVYFLGKQKKDGAS